MKRFLWLRSGLWVIGSIALSLGVLIVASLLAGAGPGQTLEAFWEGALGSPYALSETLVKFCPLALTGLAIAIAFRSGVWNIGAEGQLLIGALATVAVGLKGPVFPPLLEIPWLLLVGTFAGLVWAFPPALLRVYRGVPEVIATILLNFVALHLVSWAVSPPTGPLREASGRYPQSDLLPPSAWLPRLIPPSRLHLGVFLAFGLALFVHFLLFHTVFGYRLRAVGLNPRSARYAGIPVPRILLGSFLLSGALAGLAGSVQVLGITYRLYPDFSAGWGYTAIAVALLGGLRAEGTLVSALFMGMLEASAGSLQRNANVPSVVVQIIQGLIILLVSVQRFRPSEGEGGGS